MAQDKPGKKKSLSPDLLKLMMSEEEALAPDENAPIEIAPEENPSPAQHETLEPDVATRIVMDENSGEKFPPGNYVDPAATQARGPIKRGSNFAVAEPTLPAQRLGSSSDVTQARVNIPPRRAPPEMTPLLQSEHMRIAQIRIKELEEVVESLRVDNEQLSSASETLKHRNDELTSKLENLESRIQDVSENAAREKSFLDTSLKSKTREVSTLRLKVEELESRLHQDLRKIRVRERELENIIEIVRAEHAAVILNKDEMILSLKRKVDDLMHQMELQSQRLKDQDRFSREEHEKVKRTVKGLRAALIMLEGDDQSPTPMNAVRPPIKKAE